MGLADLTADQRARLSDRITADITEAIGEHRVADVPTLLMALALVDPKQARFILDTIRVGLASAEAGE